MGTFILIIIIVIIGVQLLKNSSEVQGNWSHLFANMEHDPREFYKLVKEILEEQKLPGVKIGGRTFKQGGALSHQRLYLEVYRGDYIFHICAAPWGNGFFFSWWGRKNMNTLEAILIKIPFIGPAIEQIMQYESYYKLDTDRMFATSVHQSVLAAIDSLTETKGIKGLSELERKPDLRTIVK